MDSVKLEVKDRSEFGTAASRRLRRDGKVPVNLYGLERTPRPMIADQHDLQMLIDRGHHIVELQQEDKQQVVLIQDVQFDALGSTVLHCDFLRIDAEKPVHVFVPVRFIGMAPEVSGSIVEKLREDVQVQVLPLRIPKEFVVNLSHLQVGESVTVADLELPEGCELYDHQPTDVVVVNHMKAHLTEDEPETTDEDAPTEPEVIGKGKGEDEDES